MNTAYILTALSGLLQGYDVTKQILEHNLGFVMFPQISEHLDTMLPTLLALSRRRFCKPGSWTRMQCCGVLLTVTFFTLYIMLTLQSLATCRVDEQLVFSFRSSMCLHLNSQHFANGWGLFWIGHWLCGLINFFSEIFTWRGVCTVDMPLTD